MVSLNNSISPINATFDEEGNFVIKQDKATIVVPKERLLEFVADLADMVHAP